MHHLSQSITQAEMLLQHKSLNLTNGPAIKILLLTKLSSNEAQVPMLILTRALYAHKTKY